MKKTPVFIAAVAAGLALTQPARAAECETPRTDSLHLNMTGPADNDATIDGKLVTGCKTGPDGGVQHYGEFQLNLPGGLHFSGSVTAPEPK